MNNISIILNTFLKLTYSKCYVLPFSLEMEFEKLNVSKYDFLDKYQDVLDENEIDEGLSEKDLSKIFYSFKKSGWDYVIDETITEIQFGGKNTISFISIGPDSTESTKEIKLKYKIHEYTNENGLTLKDWSEGVYRMKRYLHDFYRESLQNVTINKNKCEVDFIYGS